MKHAPAKLSLAIVVFLFMLQAPGCLKGQTTLTTEQIDRLYRIGQLWGHITYFHPYLQYKKIPFDSAYAAAVPGILGAKTDAELVGVLNDWLGILNDPITHADVVMAKGSKAVLLDQAFELIQKNGFAAQREPQQLPVNMVSKTPTYAKDRFPNIGYRALAAAKIYSVINYFFPNKKLMTVNWDSIVRVHIPLIVEAKDSAQYQLAVNSLYGNIQDGHGFVRGNLTIRIINGGIDRAPVVGSVVEGKYVVTRIISDSLAKVCGIEKGDIILKRNGQDVFEIINKLKQYQAHSNDVTGTAYVARFVCSGANGTEGVFTVQKKNGKIVEVKLPFSQAMTKIYSSNPSNRAKDKILRFLTPDIGYADLDRLESSQVDSMFNLFKNTKAIVFDMRGYPNGTAWTIAPRLTDKKNVAAAKFTRLERDFPLISNEDSDIRDAETWASFVQVLPFPSADKWQYKGKTVMLINESTQSQAEHTGLFFYAANGTKLIGSQTAGANGDITNFVIPGGMTMNFSGQTPSYPNGKQMQRIGLIPDVPVRPTIKGIQAGRDEVLEAAIRYLQKN